MATERKKTRRSSAPAKTMINSERTWKHSSKPSDDDLELFRSIRSCLELSDDACETVSMKPSYTPPPIISDEAEDKFQTLLTIQGAYMSAESGGKSKISCLRRKDIVKESNMLSQYVSCNDLFNGANNSEKFQHSEEALIPPDLSIDNLEMPSSSLIELHQPDASKTSENLAFPKSARGSEGSWRDGCNLDNILASIKDLEITPERIREFLPEVNWDQLALVYAPGRSGAECEARWLHIMCCSKKLALQMSMTDNQGHLYHLVMKASVVIGSQMTVMLSFLMFFQPESVCLHYLLPFILMHVVTHYRWLNHEDPLINRSPWTAEEEKNLLFIIQEQGIANWHDIAVSLGTNRTPFQCLSRYQRSLNACILNREWTKEEDDKLRLAVEAFGERDWQSAASALTGRTGTQCSNRHLYCYMQMEKITSSNQAKSGQMVQCRERWVNSLDPSLSRSKWSEEEDLRLEAAIEEHGYCWSKVAACMPSRTDNQCWRRWKVLHPDRMPLLQEARRIWKSTCVRTL
ncbi:hypothetical protein SLEP1_g17171 [Rubroshorea leprosula]|uniref:Uncharacterized protein n=1 Tax=Rubroshorea leprosula TaxID=152421 RepID=A0AAV5IZ80_9ROSI|nr:hypothetical protein SLEP1_g17171 [Rubroshorea leprosula]